MATLKIDRVQYGGGFAEITVYTVSILHNVVVHSSEYRDWLGALPDLPSLHRTGPGRKLNEIVNFGAEHPSKIVDRGDDKQIRNPDLSF